MEGSLLRSAFSGGVALTVGAAAQAGIGFLAQLVLMRLLVPEDFGRFAVVLATCGLVQTLLSLRLSVLIIRLPDAELGEDRQRELRAALIWETIAATLVTLVWLALSDLISCYTLLLVSGMALAQWSNQASAFFERTMDYRRLVTAETGAQLGGHAVGVAIALLGGGPAALYVRELVAAVVRLLVLALMGAIGRPVLRWPSWRVVRSLLREAAAFWTDGVLEGGFSRVVVLATGALTGFHGTGLFAQSQRLATIPHQLAGPVTSRLAVNVFSRAQSHSARRRLMAVSCAVALGATTLTTIAIALTADPLIPWLFGPHWRPAIPLLQAMCGFVVFLTPFELLRAYCFAVGRSYLVVLGRGIQYAAFGVSAGVALVSADPAVTLAWGLSGAYAAGFAVILICLAFRSAIRRVAAGVR